jgi:two-component system sensor histidine kinase KdpD
MDTDAILGRQPQLVLVDELAHTNVPGSPRKKRYQDVEILLNAGIDVYSTVNIQHLESLNDLVAKITGVVVSERLPDRLLNEATEVVVVDVTPETLQERLLEGKIYAPQKIEPTLQNFFQKRNLVALRELALREVADNIEETAFAGQVCSVHERVLVCISTYPNSTQLLRRGARLASAMRARLYALLVEHPERFLTRDESLYIETCEHFCREFGGEFIRVKSTKVVEVIAEAARQYHITQVILGQSHKSRWEILWRGSLVQKLVRYLKDVDLHIIATEKNNLSACESEPGDWATSPTRKRSLLAPPSRLRNRSFEILRSRLHSDKLRTHNHPVQITFYAPRNRLNQRHIGGWH